MSRCRDCAVSVEGTVRSCPLCGAPLIGHPAPSPFPTVPLRYSWRRVLRTVTAISLVVIAISLAAQLLLGHGPAHFDAVRSVWLGICTMWLIVVSAVRSRRDLARSTVTIVVLVGLLSAYWDYLTGWHGWSLDYTIPLVAASALIGLMVTVRLMRLETGDRALFSVLAVLLGLVPVAFLLLGWVSVPLPSALCGVIALVALADVQLVRLGDVRHELVRRLHL